MSDFITASQPLSKELGDLIIPLSYDVVGGKGVGVSSSIDGLLLLCDYYTYMRTGDLIEIYLYETGGTPISPITTYIVPEEKINENIFIIVPQERIKAGWFKIFYSITHVDSGLSDVSKVTDLWIKLDVPGGYDPDPSTSNINESFIIPELPATIIYNGVDATQAKKGVPVTIKPYINMRARDKVNLSWGGQIVSHVVTDAEVGYSLIITVNEDAIITAGDSESLIISYEVRDEVNNYSKWSPRQAISVNATGYRLEAPIVKEAVDNVLDLESLEQQDITVQVAVYDNNFSKNDSVLLQLSGRTSTGDSIYYEAYLVINSVPSIVEFKVAYSLVSIFSQQYFVVGYTLIKASDNSRQPSKNITITVNSETPFVLAAPTVTEAISDTLDGGLASATVVVPLFPAMTVGSEVVVFWTGTTANGDEFNYISPAQEISQITPLSFVINANSIQVLAGGTVSVYYQFTSVDKVVLISQKRILNVTRDLAAPEVTDSVNGELNPDNITTAVLVKIAPWTGMAQGDRIDLYWRVASVDNSFSDWLIVSLSAQGKPINFRVLKKYVEINLNTTVEVFYQVTQSTGYVLTSSSTFVRIRYATEDSLPAATLEQAVNGVLILNEISTSASLRIPVYPDMQVGDVVYAYLSGVVDWDEERSVTGNTLGTEIIFDISLSALAANNGTEIILHYEVARFSGARAVSPDVLIKVISSVTLLAAPSVDEANNGILSYDILLQGATLRIAPYIDMAVGDVVNVFLRGAISWDDYWHVSASSVNKYTLLSIPKNVIVASANTKIFINYEVNRVGGISTPSERLELFIRSAGIILALPVVQYAEGSLLDPDIISVNGAQVTIPHWEGMVNGDGVTLFWGEKYSLYLPVSGNMPGDDIVFTVPLNEIKVLSGQTVIVSYQVTQANGTENRSQLLTLQILSTSLPVPYIRQATGNILNTGTVTEGATVIIPAAARLRAGDVVELHWQGSNTSDTRVYTATINSADAGLDFPLVVPVDDVVANVGGTVILYYMLNRENSLSYTSPSRQYTVTEALVNNSILILGARSTGDSYRALAKSQYLVGYDKESGEQTALSWKYEGDETSTTSVWFMDASPWKKLQVSSTSETVVIQPLNILGNGNDSSDEAQAAMLAKLNNGSLVAWGSENNGAILPAVEGEISAFGASSGAMAACLVDGHVIAWGDTNSGGKVTDAIAKLTTVVSLSAASHAFAARLSDGKVVAWGNTSLGGTMPATIAAFNNISKVVGSGGAFVALRTNKRVAAWGQSAYGGLLPTAIANARNIKDIASSHAAFIALNHDNTLLSWGSADHGGVLPQAIKVLTDVSEIMASNARAFVIKRINGLVMAWGDAAYGGMIPDDLDAISDVIEIVATWSAFIALRSNGTVVTWGNKTAGGVLPREIAQLNDIVQVAATSSACAALRADGTVVVWGDVLMGGNASAVADQLVSCRAIYSSTGAFTAITTDNRIVSWGRSLCGGDNSSVSTALDGFISYQV